MLSTTRAGEPSSAKSMLSSIFIVFYLCNLIIQVVGDEGFTKLILKSAKHSLSRFCVAGSWVDTASLNDPVI
jgi:hypothetical protein